jgi:hypothetical protein
MVFAVTAKLSISIKSRIYYLQLLPDSPIPSKYFSQQIIVHIPIIIISSSLWQIFPYVIRLGSVIFLISSFNFFISILFILSFLFKKVNTVALAV